jgi:hypothetical protein
MLIWEPVSTFRKGDFVQPELAGVLLVVIGLVALTALILSWRWEKLAGIILVSCAAALGSQIATYAGRAMP